MLFFAKKLPNAQARGRRCVCGCYMVLDGNGGVRNCGGVARVIDVPMGGAGSMATVVCRLRGCGAGEWT